jgi:hypothetical protein
MEIVKRGTFLCLEGGARNKGDAANRITHEPNCFANLAAALLGD